MIRLYNLTDPETLFKEAIGLCGVSQDPPDYSRIIYITPSSLRAKAATKAFHKIMQLGSTACYIPPDITTLLGLLKQLSSLYGLKTLIPWSLTPILISRLSGKGMGLSVLISDLISDLKQYHPEKDTGEIRVLLINKMKELNIPESLIASITEGMEIFSLYQDFLDKNGLIDVSDLLKVCPEYIRKHMNPSVAIIDGFYSPTKAEMEIIKALIERSEYSLIAIPCIEGFEDITGNYIAFLRDNFKVDGFVQNRPIAHDLNFKYYPYDDIEAEVEGVARRIKSLFVAKKIKDLSQVVIAFPELDKYKDSIERIFFRYGIPVNITKKKPLAKTGPFIDLFCMLQSICEDYPRLKFSQFLSSRYFKDIPQSLRAWIPTLSPQSGIASGKKAWLNFLSKGNERFDIKGLINDRQPESLRLFASDPSSINSLKDIVRDINYVFELLAPLEGIKDSASIASFSTTLKNTLKELGFLDVNPTHEKYRLYSDMKSHLWDCLDRLSLLDKPGLSSLRLQEFSEYLWHFLNNTYVEKDKDGVTATDISGAFYLSFQEIYLGGLTDEDMPRYSVDYILPDSVKRGMGLPDLGRQLRLQKFLFEYILKSSRGVHLSYPTSDNEKKFLPSPFLYSGQLERERLPGIFSKEELLVMQAKKPFTEYLSEIRIETEVPHLKGILNVTDIDAYRSCPRRFFIERVLNLQPLAIKEYDLEPAVLGDIIHRIMESIIFEPLDDLERLMKRAVEVADVVAESKNIDLFWRSIVKETFLEILPDIVRKEIEIREDGYSPLKVEEKITGEPVKGIRLKGKIDRIDKSDNGLALIDYKTGSDSITCSKVCEGKERLQLFLYAALLKSQGEGINRVGIYSLKEINVKWCPPKRKRGKGAEMDEMVRASIRFLEESVKALRKGIFVARPLDDGYYACRACHENPLCPYIQS